MLKKVSEGRDSYITALCVMTKEINNQSQFDTKKQTKAQDLTSQSKLRGSGQTKPTLPTENQHENLQVNNSKSTGPANKVTVVIGDSMVKHVQGRKIGRRVGHEAVVKAFPAATTADMKYHLKPLPKQNQRWENDAFFTLCTASSLILGARGFAVQFYSVQDCPKLRLALPKA